MQHNENSKPNRFQHFLREKGYYIVLALCICAVGVSGWLFLSGAIAEKNALSEPAMSVATETEIPSQPAKTPTQPSASKPAAVTKPAESAPVSQTDEQVYAQAANVRVWPVSGETQSAYSMEQLAFNATTRDWRTHEGLDLAAALGDPVCAAADGTVYTIYEDERYGTTVVLRHSGGFTTHYANLTEEPDVAVGDTVRAGQRLGTVGQTALTETGDAPHVHFALYNGNTPEDPAEYWQ